MRKPLCFLINTLFITSSLFWNISEPVSAQDLSGFSICLDPGHGRGNMNQGPTGLREADINVTVSLFLKQFLKSANIDTVLLTRVDDSTNPSLSQREALANNFGVDWFHSVHHNAFDGTRRFTLLLYEEERTFANPCPNGSARGTDVPAWPDLADAMSQTMASLIFEALRTSFFTDRLDWTFFGGCDGGFSLGVLNDLLMPGELSEATFHDNIIEENKLRNNDFLKLEARALFMAFLDFYDAGTLPTGALAGIITDDETNEPLNGAEVILNPVGFTYTTDNNNNGLYVFHDLAPETYEVVVSAAGFEGGERMVKVDAHHFSFVDFSLLPARLPVVTTTLPEDGTTDFDVYDEIGIRFSRPMERESVEAAFSTEPDAAGHFIWNTDDDVMLFEPNTRFEFDTEYRVRIAGSAMDKSGRLLDGNGDGEGGDDFFFEFTTTALDTNRPVVLDFFPVRRDTAVFLKEVIWAQFNRELDPNSINKTTVSVTGNGGVTADVQMDYVQDGSRRLTLVPKETLLPDLRYFVTFSSGLSLMDGEELEGSFKWQFNTQNQPIDINFLDDFEADLLWADPNDSPITRGHVPDSTSFQLTQKVFITKSNSAEFTYVFSGQSGFIQLDNLDQNSINLQEVSDFAFYVYGDNSKNEIRIFFADIDGEEALAWTAIDWSGWKLLRFKLQQVQLDPGVGGNGIFDGEEIQLAGIQLNFAGQNRGTLFFDDFFETRVQTPVFVAPTPTETSMPNEFLLSQNYPNPFNPETVITYAIPTNRRLSEQITLKIYNLAGQEIRTLVQAEYPPGSYKVIWDGKDNSAELVPSGLYIYRIKVGDLTETKRMIFLK